MLCHVTRPDSVVMEVEVDAKANGEDCLNKVRYPCVFFIRFYSFFLLKLHLHKCPVIPGEMLRSDISVISYRSRCEGRKQTSLKAFSSVFLGLNATFKGLFLVFYCFQLSKMINDQFYKCRFKQYGTNKTPIPPLGFPLKCMYAMECEGFGSEAINLNTWSEILTWSKSDTLFLLFLLNVLLWWLSVMTEVTLVHIPCTCLLHSFIFNTTHTRCSSAGSSS